MAAFDRRFASVLLAASSLSACASGQMVTTTQGPTNTTALTPVAGLPYYLPYAYVPVTVVGTPPADAKSPYVGNITLGSTVSVPDTTDPAAPYLLVYTHDKSADDTQTVTVNSAGLLEGVSGNATDQTGAVIGNIPQIVGQLAALFSPAHLPAGLGAAAAVANTTQCELPPFSWSTLVDPADRRTPAATNGDLYPSKPRYLVGQSQSYQNQSGNQTVAVSVYATPMETPSTAVDLTASLARRPVQGVLFRTPMLYLIDVEVRPLGTAGLKCNIQATDKYELVAIPNGGHLYTEDMSRASAVKKTVALTIQDGMLTGISVSHPSEYVAYVNDVESFVSGVLSAISIPLTIKIQHEQAEGNLTAAYYNLVQQETNLINQEASFAKAQAAQNAPSPTPTPAPK